jgi:HK97 family phage prohead protease
MIDLQEEKRFLPGDDAAAIEQRDGEAPKIVGYAAVFNTLSNEMRMPDQSGRTFREVIRPGAFAEALASGDDVLARFEHIEILGRTGNGTLRLTEDERGLRYEIDPPNTTAGRDVVELIKRKDLRGSSFVMKVRQPGGDAWRREGQTLVREIRSVRLVDVAPVSTPAYPATDVALRSLDYATQSHGIEGETIPPEYPTDLPLKRLALAERL